MASATTALAQPYTSTVASTAYRPGVQAHQAVSTAKYLGYPGAGMLGSDVLESLYSTVPAHQWYWHVWLEASDLSTTLTNVIFVTIDYDILWFDKVDGALDIDLRRVVFLKEGRVVNVPSGLDSKFELKRLLSIAEHSEDEKSDFVTVETPTPKQTLSVNLTANDKSALSGLRPGLYPGASKISRLS
jgi:hypothetical protein